MSFDKLKLSIKSMFNKKNKNDISQETITVYDAPHLVYTDEAKQKYIEKYNNKK